MLLLGVFALLAASCGSDDDDASDGADTDDESAQTTAAPAVESTTTTPPPPRQIAYLSASSANTWLLASLSEMEKVAAENNLEIVEFDAQFDPAMQSAQFNDVIASGNYDGVILVAIAGLAIAPDIEAAIAAGLEVVILNQVVGADYSTAEPQVDGVSASVMTAPLQSGLRLGALAVQACEDIDPCEVVYIFGIKGIPLDDALREGFDDVIADYPHISVVAEGEGQYLGPQGGINATQDILQVAPDFDVLVGADQSVQGAEIVLAEEGKLDEVALIGLGGSQPAIDGIKSGAWFGGVFGAPGDEGRLAMEAMLSVLNGEGDVGGVDTLDTLPDMGLVTAANVDLFTSQWAG